METKRRTKDAEKTQKSSNSNKKPHSSVLMTDLGLIAANTNPVEALKKE